MSYIYTDLIRAAYRGEMAHRHVTEISGFHRIQASPGYRAAAQYVAAQLSDAGLQVNVLAFPADGVARFWTCPSFLEWSCDAATLHLLPPDAGRPHDTGASPVLLCDFAVKPISLIQRSIPVEGEFELTAPKGKGGIDPADYEGLDVKGKVVLTNRPVARVAAVAVRQLGAAGILFDGMEAGGRTELDLPDALQYTSFWWGGQAQPDAWGFVVSPRQGRGLRQRLERGETLRVRASIDSEFYPGAFEVVEARLPGDEQADGEEILLVSHLCHPQPGGNDNGSGAAALIEAAVTLARLISDGKLPAPRRGIRFIWPPEMTGTFAYLSETIGTAGACDEDAPRDPQRYVAGLNLDMVGEDQSKTGSQWELVGLPLAGASFADHLLSWLREPFLAGIRYAETPFSAGSDHYILSDPTVGIPSPMLIQWPDRFYHTSEDTPDKVSPDSLARSGSLAATYAYWLATAGAAEAEWLAHLMVSRFTGWAGRAASEVVETVRGARTGAERAAVWNRYLKLNAFRAERMERALSELERLDPAAGKAANIARERVAQRAATEMLWATTTLDGLVHSGAEEAAPLLLVEAASLVPCRTRPGPIDVAQCLQADHPELLPRLWALHEALGPSASDYTPVLQYWSDGTRSVAEIGELAWLEIGRPADDCTLEYFKLLAEAGLIELRRRDGERAEGTAGHADSGLGHRAAAAEGAGAGA
ncbi:MAG: DUF4910 domain-containing protein [Nitrososphaerales archaeon]